VEAFNGAVGIQTRQKPAVPVSPVTLNLMIPVFGSSGCSIQKPTSKAETEELEINSTS